MIIIGLVEVYALLASYFKRKFSLLSNENSYYYLYKFFNSSKSRDKKKIQPNGIPDIPTRYLPIAFNVTLRLNYTTNRHHWPHKPINFSPCIILQTFNTLATFPNEQKQHSSNVDVRLRYPSPAQHVDSGDFFSHAP